MKWFIKRGVLIVFLIPSLWYIKDLVAGTGDLDWCVGQADDLVRRGTDWVNRRLRDKTAREIEEEEARLTADIAEVRAALEDLEAAGATEKAADHRRLLGHLTDRRDQVLAVKNEYLAERNQKAIAAERFRMLQVDDTATQANFASARRILAYEVQIAGARHKAEARKAADVVEAFLDALDRASAADARAVCSAALAPRLTERKISALRATNPTEVEFHLRPAGESFDVLFGSEVRMKMAKEQGTWKVSETW